MRQKERKGARHCFSFCPSSTLSPGVFVLRLLHQADDLRIGFSGFSLSKGCKTEGGGKGREREERMDGGRKREEERKGKDKRGERRK